MRTFLFMAFSIALVVLTATQCRSSGLPETRPEDFVVELSESGGMMPVWARVEIGPEGGVYETHYQQSEARVEFPVSTQTLDELYRVIRENRFDRITTHEEQVTDRGGTAIGVTAGGERIDVSNSGLTFVDGAWSDEWGRISEAVWAVANEAAEALAVEVPVSFDERLYGSTIMIQRNDETPFSGEVGAESALILRQAPGDYVLAVAIASSPDAPMRYASRPVSLVDGRGVRVSLDAAGQPTVTVE